MTPQELKNSILQMAIQGKLVEQRPEEGTAEELFTRIQEEKQRLAKEKKIKKEKPLPEVMEEEKPFDIPKNWKWVRLREIANVTGGYAFKSSDFGDYGVRVIRISDFNENGFVNNKIVRHLFDESLVPFLIEEKNIVLCMTGGTVGKSYFVRNIDEPMMTNQRVATIKIIINFEEYINFVILSPIIQRIIRTSKNSTNDNISINTINSFPIPLPPLAEQKRIVAKIEELLSYIDRYEQAWCKLEKFNSRFPEDMKKSLLQYAIQGKLVEQRPEEGTAEELFEQIQEEKQRLVAEKKIKKEKSLPEITDDEKPFDIPESWKWVRLGDITSKLTDGSHNPPPNTGSGYPVISAKNVKDGVITFENVNRFTDDEGFKKENSRTNIIRGDIIMGIIGGSIGNVAIYTHDKRVIAQRSIAIMRFLINIEFSRILLESPLVQNKLMISTSGSAQGGVYLGSLKNLPIPLPPLPEQKRIVEKIEQLLPLCEKLK